MLVRECTRSCSYITGKRRVSSTLEEVTEIADNVNEQDDGIVGVCARALVYCMYRHGIETASARV